MTKRIYTGDVRRFLNKHGRSSYGSLQGTVTVEEGEDRVWFDGSLHISDCSRSITLEFDIGGPYGTTPEEMLTKAERLEDGIKDFVAALREAVVAYEKAQAERKAKQAKLAKKSKKSKEA